MVDIEELHVIFHLSDPSSKKNDWRWYITTTTIANKYPTFVYNYASHFKVKRGLYADVALLGELYQRTRRGCVSSAFAMRVCNMCKACMQRVGRICGVSNVLQ